MAKNITYDLFGSVEKPDRINSKLKGNKNELNVAKWLTLWVGVPFSRVPNSGGLRWKNNASVCGDVVCEDDKFKFLFSVETKAYKNLRCSSILPINSQIAKFFLQAENDALRAQRLPMLMVRSNGMPKGTYVIYFMFELPNIDYVSKGPYGSDTIYGYDSADVMKHVKYKELEEYLYNRE